MTRHRTVVDAIRQHALDGSQRTVGSLEPELIDLPYPAYWSRVSRCAQELRSRGVRPNDRVAVSMSTSMDVLIATVAVWAAGGVLVPLPGASRLRPGSISCQRAATVLALSGARWCLTPESALASYSDVVREADMPAVVLPLPEFTMDGPPTSSVLVEPSLNDPALIQFSSGSTAQPRGIVLTHRNVVTQVDDLTARLGLDGHARGMGWLPLSHDMGLIGCFLSCLYGGSAWRAMAPRSFVVNPLRWIEELSAFGATHTAGPTFGYALVTRLAEQNPDLLASWDLSVLESASIGGEHIAPEICEQFERVFAQLGLRRHVLNPGYGLAENTLGVAAKVPLTPTTVRAFSRSALTAGRLSPVGDDTAEDHLALVGHGATFPRTTVRVVSTDGAVLSEGEVGEIQVGGQSATSTIIDAHRERPAQQDGFVPTGDLGSLLDGQLYVVGRLKEIFKFGGQTFAPTDLEAAIRAVDPPGVMEVVAVAVRPDGAATEEPIVFLGLSTPETAEAAAETARLALLREFQMPVREVFTAEPGALPRTTSGKYQRTQIAAAYLDGTLRELYGVRPTGRAEGREESQWTSA
ncbi:hypothetical protein CDO52_03740 [Nocardiopsis gilva YIM 90087]|uniref:AMP-dependent synthetase/ligase domain-containing protein n=1 Tax=Nocardiopsis gilva YIM 90087 TaxID=1235441 RepID=A0A223S1V4_9ACTN|nr:AMP-binding protein [Nocardiopsis gilva]ASU82009.1 hypothetical protein CDO52_03740 [Nocardiopsis gilva YIM 90087]